ncbi:MAG: peptidoglycan-associated lipoprotein Pal [Elusimicrobia bacterium]|nr:peptidoglycan-associated lipoprotein Pal [Elusimicrobiota bacterium]
MKRWIYLALCGALATAVSAGCAGRAVKKAKKDKAASQEQAAAEAGQEDGTEASLRGKDYIPSSELSRVHFEYDMHQLTDETRQALKKNAEWLRSNPKVEVKIEGHCDDRGTEQYNLALGQKRANAVRDYYKALGVKIGRMSTISYGEEQPLCHESTEECGLTNRRAETLIRKK